jgi:hypothetical protein
MDVPKVTARHVREHRTFIDTTIAALESRRAELVADRTEAAAILTALDRQIVEIDQLLHRSTTR